MGTYLLAQVLILSEQKVTTADVELGVVSRLSSMVSVHMSVDYNTNLDGNNMEGVGGNLSLG